MTPLDPPARHTPIPHPARPPRRRPRPRPRPRADEPSGRQAPPSTAAQRERLKERDRLGEQAQKLQAAGKLDQAIKAADAKLSIEREVLGTDSDDAIVSLSFLARLHVAREDWAAARSARREALDRLTARLGKDHWRVTHARQALADIDVLAGIGAEQRRRLAMAGRLHSEAFELRKKGKNREATAPARQGCPGDPPRRARRAAHSGHHTEPRQPGGTCCWAPGGPQGRRGRCSNCHGAGAQPRGAGRAPTHTQHRPWPQQPGVPARDPGGSQVRPADVRAGAVAQPQGARRAPQPHHHQPQ